MAHKKVRVAQKTVENHTVNALELKSLVVRR